MNITSAPPISTLVRPANTAAAITTAEAEAASPQTPKDTFKTNVTRAAYASGGALGGLALGAVSGEVMTHLTKNEIFSTLGGGVGAIGGAATSLALAFSDEPVSIARTFGSWAGATAGATGGMYMMRGIGESLAANGAASYFGTHGALIGAVGLGLTGAGIAFAGDESKVATFTKCAAKGGAGAMLGMAAGGGIQALMASNLPAHVATIGISAPLVLAGALGLIGVQNEINEGWFNAYKYKPQSEALDVVSKTAMGAAMGYVTGSALGGIALAVGGSSAYSVLGPAVGAAVGASAMLGDIKKNKTFGDMAVTAGLGSCGGLIGDAVGHGLTALTGQPAFQMLGVAAGAVTGATLVLDHQQRINAYVAPLTAGLSAGTVAGTLLGAGLTALTGHSAYQLAGTAIGAAAGVFAGLASAAQAGKETSPANPE